VGKSRRVASQSTAQPEQETPGRGADPLGAGAAFSLGATIGNAFLKDYVAEGAAAGVDPARAIQREEEPAAPLMADHADPASATPEGSVDHLTGEEIDEHLTATPLIQHYVREVMQRGVRAAGNTHFHDDASFRAAYAAVAVKYTNNETGQRYTLSEGEARSSGSCAITDGAEDEIHIHEDRGDVVTGVHEGVHLYSNRAYGNYVGLNANEGTTEHFALQVAEAADLQRRRRHYGRETRCADDLADTVGETMLANAYFQGNISGLKGAVDRVGAGTFDYWVGLMKAGEFGDASDALSGRIQAASSEILGTDEEGVYAAIRESPDREALREDPELRALLNDELSGHDLWRAELLMLFGDESDFPTAVREIWEATEGGGTDEDGIYGAIRDCSDPQALGAIDGVRRILSEELSGHELWRAQLLMVFGHERMFPDAIQEIWEATEGGGTDEDRIFAALEALTPDESVQIAAIPGLRAILNDELSGDDLARADASLGYADAIARHRENVEMVGRVLDGMSESDDLLLRNTAQWFDDAPILPSPYIDPTAPGAGPGTMLRVLTPTHDSERRAAANASAGQVAYFGLFGAAFPDSSARYDPDLAAPDLCYYASSGVSAVHLSGEVRLFDPLALGVDGLQTNLVHELQHEADRHDLEPERAAGPDTPERAWNHYKSEFRAYWLDGEIDNLSEISGSTAAPWDNQRQESLFRGMYNSATYGEWLQPNYDQDQLVGGQSFQALIHGYAHPEGVNLLNSPRLNALYLSIRGCSPDQVDTAEAPLSRVMSAAGALDPHDRAYLETAEAARFREDMARFLSPDAAAQLSRLL